MTKELNTSRNMITIPNDILYYELNLNHKNKKCNLFTFIFINGRHPTKGSLNGPGNLGRNLSFDHFFS